MGSSIIELCKKQEANHFLLTIYISQRAHELAGGSKALIAEPSDKNIFTAAQEISEGLIDLRKLEKAFLRRKDRDVSSFGYAPENDELSTVLPNVLDNESLENLTVEEESDSEEDVIFDDNISTDEEST